MRRGYRWFGLLALPSLLAACGGVAEPGDGQMWTGPDGNPYDPEAWAAPTIEQPGEAWFVEFESAPLVRGGSDLALQAERSEFQRRASRAGIRYHQRLAFGRLWNGISVRVHPEDIDKLSALEGVKAMYPVLTVERDDAQPGDSNSPELYAALAMTGADIAHNTLGLTGDGVKVGIIDTGTDYDNPDLGGCFGPGCHVAMGVDLVGDAYDSNSSNPTYNPVPTPDDDPDDCAGHGSHVSGIVAADGDVVGVAPGVTLGAYRVFGCVGSTSTDIMTLAMEKAAGDGMRVVNMSIGSPFTWPGYPSAVAANNLVDDGVVVVTSIGNSGADGLYAVGAPGIGSKVIGTASIENTHLRLNHFQAGPGNLDVGYLPGVNSPAVAIPLTGAADLARTGTPAATADACNVNGVSPLAPGSLTGKVALIRRGTCGFYEKTKNAQAAGAVGVIIYNNVLGFIAPSVTGSPPVTIPVVGTSDLFGAQLDAIIAAGAAPMAWQGGESVFANPVAGQISSFSSYGPAADLSLKPDVAAPGGNIYSTYPMELGGHATLSGTSMASPHVTGLVALLLQARPDLTASEVRAALQNSAKPYTPFNRVDPDFTFRQGAGMARIDVAALENVMITPSKLALGESSSGAFTQTLTIKNPGQSDVTFNLSHRASLNITGTTLAPTVSTTGYATVGFSAPSVTVPAGGQATVDVTITPPALAALPQNGLFGGYVVLTDAANATRALNVPYGGFSGDYQAITAVGTKLLAKVVNGSLQSQPSGAKYTMKGNDIPYFAFHYNHHITQLKLDVYAVANPADLTKLKAQGTALTLDLIGRHQTATQTSSYSWNGTTKSGKTTYTAPNGYYVVKMSALKSLGDPANPAHWETWTSPLITIARN